MAIISKEELKKLAQISSLQLNDDEIASFAQQIQGVLTYAERVTQIAKDITIPSSKQVNVLREDVVQITNKEEVLGQAPEREQDYFVVPVIIQSNK